jgi:predicted kinase
LKERLDEAQFWVAEQNDAVIGWVGIRADEIYGLYVDPQWANQGIGSGLLRLAEAILLIAGVTTVRLQASWNAEGFYERQGYRPTGPRPVDDTRLFTKSLTDSTRPAQDFPSIVVLAGLPGTGKTTLAYAIARVLRWIVLDKDLVNTVLISNGLGQNSAGPLSYDVLLQLADDMIAAQRHSVILDTAGRQPLILEHATQIAKRAPARLRVISLIAPREVRMQRMAAREARPSQWVEDETTDLEEAKWYSHLPADTLTISSVPPVPELLPKALEFLRRREP